MTVDPAVIDFLWRGGLLAGSILAVYAFLTGKVRPGSQVDKERERDDQRHATETAELRKDRDEWKTVAQTSLARQDRIIDAFEDLAGKPAPD
jgi:hypothetical protein